MRSDTSAAALARCEAARKAAGLRTGDAEAVTVEPPHTRAGDSPEAEAVALCWRCEESCEANGADDEADALRQFWSEHRSCKPELPELPDYCS